MPLALERLSLENLHTLDSGAAVKQFLRLLEQAQVDINSRPGEKRPRKIKIELSLTPKTVTEVDEDTGHGRTSLIGAAMSIQLDIKLPNRRTLEYDLGFSADGALVFNRESPFDFRQPTLFDSRTVDGAAREAT